MRSRSRGRALACGAVLLALLGGCVAGGETRTSPRARPASTPSPEPTRATKPEVLLDDGAHGAVAPGDRIVVSARRGGRGNKTALTTQNPLGQRLVFLIVGTATDERDREWLQLSTPERPNGSTGWARRAGLQIVRLHHRIEIDLSKFELRHFRDDKLVDHFKVGIGQDQYPSPVGSFYIWARVPQPSPTGPYGIYALGISGFSPVLSDWPGGGRAAIHGTAVPTDPGTKVSHGCIRVFNANMATLTRLPMGTPVIIRR